MDIINLGMVKTNYSTVPLPEIKQFRIFCNSNNNKVAAFYSKYSRYFGSGHFLNSLILKMYAYFGNNPSQTYQNLCGRDLDIAYAFRLGGVTGNQEPRSIYLGEDYILAGQECRKVGEDYIPPSFDEINGNMLNYHGVKPVTILSSTEMSFQPLSPNIKGDVVGRTVIVIDFPTLGAALHQWYIDSQVDEDSVVMEEKFIGDIFYARTYLDFLNHAILNRLTLLAYNIGYNGDDSTLTEMGYTHTPLGNIFNKAMTVLLNKLASKSSMSAMELLANIPLATGEDARSMLLDFNTLYSPTLGWGIALNQKDLISKVEDILVGLGIDLEDSYMQAATKKFLNPAKAKIYYNSLHKDNREWLKKSLS